jgi:hypothetical protein
MKSLKNTARVSGLLYLMLAITGAYGIMYVPSQLVVTDDSAQTMNNILQHEFFFRSGILGNVIGQTAFLFLGLSLYKLFEGVSQSLSRTLLILITASVPISFFIIFNQVYAVSLLKESFIQQLDPAQMQLMTMSFIKMYSYGNLVIGIFWGLWLIPFGKLVCESGFMPKLLGALLILGGTAYVIDACTFILFPGAQHITTIFVAILSSIAELFAVIWLLAIGTREMKRTSGPFDAVKS